MAPRAAAKPAPQVQPQAAPAAVVPFDAGSYHFSEPLNTINNTAAAGSVDFAMQLPPNGYLRGVLLTTSATYALGGGTLNPDYPYSMYSGLTLEGVDGTSYLYPMGGYAYYLVERYCRPFYLDPAKDPSFLNGTLTFWRLMFSVELRQTLGALSNVDARSQYRFRGTFTPLNAWITGGAPTGGVTALVSSVETWAQPPATSLSGSPIQQVPDGLAVQRFVSHELDPTPGGSFTKKLSRVGNMIRTIILVVRDSTGARVDLTADPIRFRVDTTYLFTETRNRRDWIMTQRSSWNTWSARPTGVYVFSFWQDRGKGQGTGWLETTEATYVGFELNGCPAGGSLETIIEDLAPLGQGVSAYLEDI